ncbi:hypothetical protein [Olsenella massiliensis]|uniref:hypothetical protein n=1 Tax=Olsenella massiliensis TaxID=1622075 RepID=UPI00071CA307|nr:hypothetical protein [Olsenella massiliensis]
MALTRKMLKALGIEDDKADEIIEAHAETVNSLKRQADDARARSGNAEALQREVEELKERLKAAGTVHDVLRHTFSADAGDFSKESRRVRSSLEGAGYTMAEVKNTLQFKRRAYRGVNAQVLTPDGYVFDLQFHTPESLGVKEGLTHRLYERSHRQETDKGRLNVHRMDDTGSVYETYCFPLGR